MSSYTETRAEYAKNRIHRDRSADELEARERVLLDIIDDKPECIRWKGTAEEIELTQIQAELEIRMFNPINH